MRILIIDSSTEIANRLEEILSESASEKSIYKAATYKDAVSFYKEYYPDVVLLDLSLHGNESFELLKSIKKSGKESFVIILSIHVDTRTREQCKRMGADLFFDKYNDFEKIPGTINEISKKLKTEKLSK